MPDRWGRTTFQDFNSIAQGLKGIQAIGQNQTLFNQQQKALADQEQFQSDANYNAGLYTPGAVKLDEGSPYQSEGEAREAAMRGTPAARAKGKQIAAAGMEADRAINAAQTDAAVLSKEKELWQTFSTIPENQRDQFLDNFMPQSKAEFQAFASFSTSLEQNEQFQQNRMQRNIVKGQNRFKKWNATLMAGKEFLDSGDSQMAEKYIEAAIKEAHHPLFIQKNKNGTYDLIYKEMGQESLVGDDITLAQVYDKAVNIPSKQFLMDYVAQKQMIAKKNREANFTTWEKGGEAYEVTTVYKPSSPDAGMTVIYKEGGGIATKDDGAPMTLDDLKSGGFRPKNLDDELKQQKITTSKALQGKYQKEGAAAGDKASIERHAKLTKQYKNDLAFVLTPFAKPGTDIASMFSEDGSLTSEGKGALQAAMSFVQDNPDPSQLSELDQMKWQRGKDAIQLYNGMSQTIVSSYRQGQAPGQEAPTNAGGNTPPVKGARKAKDGFWYVQKDGQWHRVVDAKSGGGIVDVPDELKSSHGDPQAAIGGPPPQQQSPAGDYQGTPPAGGGQQPAIRPELPQDMSQWNVQIIPQNGRQVPVVITDQGAIPLTEEELEMYKRISSRRKQQSMRQAMGHGAQWIKENMTGTHRLPEDFTRR